MQERNLLHIILIKNTNCGRGKIQIFSSNKKLKYQNASSAPMREFWVINLWRKKLTKHSDENFCWNYPFYIAEIYDCILMNQFWGTKTWRIVHKSRPNFLQIFKSPQGHISYTFSRKSHFHHTPYPLKEDGIFEWTLNLSTFDA